MFTLWQESSCAVESAQWNTPFRYGNSRQADDGRWQAAVAQGRHYRTEVCPKQQLKEN